MTFGPLAFLDPWMLLALLALPAIFWLLRVTPPTPRRQTFPPVRLLMMLTPTEETPAATPLWLLLLRLLLAALVILALARPTLDPGGEFKTEGPLLLVVDDGWAAADGWARRVEAMDELLTRAARERKPVMILPTAPAATESAEGPPNMMSATEARARVRALGPKPWDVDRALALERLRALSADQTRDVVWLADGLDDGHAARLAERLGALGELLVMAPDVVDAKVLGAPDSVAGGFALVVRRLANQVPETTRVLALGEGGRVLGAVEAAFTPGAEVAETLLRLPNEVRNRVARLAIEGEDSAAAVLLLDERWRRRPVGIHSGADARERSQPLLSNSYYLGRAMAPFAELGEGALAELLERPLAMIVLADVGSLSPGEADRVGRWVEAGGMLVRFAGPRLAQNADDLLPVRLRGGGRALGGALTWTRPARLAPFHDTSPFHGLAIPDDVRVNRQVLAEPSLELDGKTWAWLTDGTPLVTAERRGEGWLVLFHTTANTSWSNLPISGLFVEMMRRLLGLSRGVAGEEGSRLLPPLASLDGQGHLGGPAATAVAIPADRIDGTPVGPRHPPGFYGTEESRRALNLVRGGEALRPLPPTPVGALASGYETTAETDLKPWLLLLALALGLIDVVAALALRGVLPRLTGARAASLAALAILALAATAAPRATLAQSDSPSEPDRRAIEATSETRLAHVLTGNDEIDSLAHAGLVGLSEVLRLRTSIEAAEPLSVDLEVDELAFFSLLYWPITPDQEAISDRAAMRLNAFMKTGGTILFDTRDAQLALPALGRRGGGTGGPLRRLLRRLDVPPLVPVPQEHVLTKAFYLMQGFPGRYAGGRLWVELPPGGVNDGVASVIIGGNDWAAAWAVDGQGRHLAAVVPGGARQRELAYRFGVNLVMYTLTGNYKADQVHVPAILERLGQ